MQVVWGEVLFALDFSMDFCALYFMQRLRSKPIRRTRIILSAILCAITGVLSVACECTAALQWILFLLSAGMAVCITDSVKIGASGWKKALLGGVFLFFFLEVTAGGVMTFLFYRLNRFFLSAGITAAHANGRHTAFWSSAALLFAVFSLITRISGREKARALCQRSGHITVGIKEKRTSVPCIYDSGCLAKEPISGRHVIVLPEACLTELGYEKSALESGRLPRSRLIPTATVSGEETLYWAIHPDEILLWETDVRSSACNVDAYVMFSSHIGDSAIVPMGL